MSQLGRDEPSSIGPSPVEPSPVRPSPFGPSPVGPSPVGPGADKLPLLQVEQVTKTFHVRHGVLGRRVDVTAVDKVDLQIERGQTFGLVGETGSGKSTLGRLALGLEQPSSGEVRIDGKPIGQMSTAELKRLRSRVQVVFQDPYESLNPYMTIKEVLEEPFKIHGTFDKVGTRERVRELVERVGLSPSALSRKPGELSGGQQQRVAIARAVSLGPDLLVADEPTAALDVSIQAQILNLLLDLRRERAMSMLLISHNLLVVRHMSTALGVMYAGRIVETGRSEDIYRSPKHPYSVALLSAVPIANPRREHERQRVRIPGDAPDPARLPRGCPFHPRCSRAVERCRTERPLLRPVGAAGQQAACHVAQ